ncbi:universal stress protein [Halostagnicola bangensis]
MFDTILIPTDGSEYARAAAQKGLELAQTHSARVHIVSVADAGPLGDIRLPGDASSAEDAMSGRATEYVEEIAEKAQEHDIEVMTAVRTGSPGKQILEAADEVDADVIVMGTRGRGGVHRMAVGSVTDHVIRFGDIPVFVANSGSEQ